MNESIALRIQKLLKLGESPNEHEAQSAINKAYKLMALHNISLNELNNSEYIERVLHTATGRRRMVNETDHISYILRDHFKVIKFRTIRHLGSSKKCKKEFNSMIYGTQANVEIAQYVHDYLVKVYKDLYTKNKKENKFLHKQSFYFGLTKSLDQKLQQTETSLVEEYGLIIVNDPKLHEFHESLEKWRTPSINIEPTSYMTGCEKGEEINIHAGLGQ